MDDTYRIRTTVYPTYSRGDQNSRLLASRLVNCGTRVATDDDPIPTHFWPKEEFLKRRDSTLQQSHVHIMLYVCDTLQDTLPKVTIFFFWNFHQTEREEGTDHFKTIGVFYDQNFAELRIWASEFEEMKKIKWTWFWICKFIILECKLSKLN